MVSSRWLKILCHCLHQKVVIIFPPLDLGWLWVYWSNRSSPSRSRPSLSEDCSFCFLPLGTLELGTLPLGTQLPCWEGLKPHTPRGPQAESTGSPVGEPSWTSQPVTAQMTSQPRSSSVKASPQENHTHKREQNVFFSCNLSVICTVAIDNLKL